jgi:hypothetical protein
VPQSLFATELQARHTIAVAWVKGGVGKSTLRNLLWLWPGPGTGRASDADVYVVCAQDVRAEMRSVASAGTKDWIQPVEKTG